MLPNLPMSRQWVHNIRAVQTCVLFLRAAYRVRTRCSPRAATHHEGGLWEQKCTYNFCSLTPQMGDRITSDPTSEAIGGHWRPLNSVQIVSKFFTGLYRVLLNMVNMASWSHQICPPRPLEAVEHL